ncbi:MAG TPA: hypothetical protein EYH34_05050 [Planctomycetes bacterium]|nr:hypothetical protein [Planctomycetota bacterium]
MALIIDGSNLLNASGVFTPAGHPHTLQWTRRALLDFLADHLSRKTRAATRVVFDAKQRPRAAATCCAGIAG